MSKVTTITLTHHSDAMTLLDLLREYAEEAAECDKGKYPLSKIDPEGFKLEMKRRKVAKLIIEQLQLYDR